MMQALSNLSGWLNSSSASYPSPCSAKPPKRNFFNQPVRSSQPVEMVEMGRYAEILPWDFSTPPTSDFDPQSLPLFCSLQQAAVLDLPPVAQLGPPSGQGRAFDRLWHMVGKMEDAKLRLDPTWRWPDGWRDRLVAILGLSDPDAPIADQIAAQGLSGINPDVPLLAVPTFKFSAKERAAIGHRLPFLP
jgi:hypothetical protein